MYSFLVGTPAQNCPQTVTRCAHACAEPEYSEYRLLHLGGTRPIKPDGKLVVALLAPNRTAGVASHAEKCLLVRSEKARLPKVAQSVPLAVNGIVAALHTVRHC